MVQKAKRAAVYCRVSTNDQSCDEGGDKEVFSGTLWAQHTHRVMLLLRWWLLLLLLTAPWEVRSELGAGNASACRCQGQGGCTGWRGHAQVRQVGHLFAGLARVQQGGRLAQGGGQASQKLLLLLLLQGVVVGSRRRRRRRPAPIVVHATLLAGRRTLLQWRGGARAHTRRRR